ncbi:MAG: hypothetical protein R3B97_09250 [Dehalococcoidia bacterium]
MRSSSLRMVRDFSNAASSSACSEIGVPPQLWRGAAVWKFEKKLLSGVAGRTDQRPEADGAFRDLFADEIDWMQAPYSMYSSSISNPEVFIVDCRGFRDLLHRSAVAVDVGDDGAGVSLPVAAISNWPRQVSLPVLGGIPHSFPSIGDIQYGASDAAMWLWALPLPVWSSALRRPGRSIASDMAGGHGCR